MNSWDPTIITDGRLQYIQTEQAVYGICYKLFKKNLSKKKKNPKQEKKTALSLHQQMSASTEHMYQRLVVPSLSGLLQDLPK
jgi:tRNA C32,U32 (ribose-2'-O)-methylase TrmJ